MLRITIISLVFYCSLLGQQVALYPFQDIDGKWGYINKQGKIVIKPKFDEASVFSDGVAYASINNSKYGYINTMGRFVIKPQFDEVSEYSSGLAAVKVTNKWGFINKQGKYVVDLSYDDANVFSEGLAAIQVGTGFSQKYIGENQYTWKYGKYGFINSKGKFVINPQFDAAGWFSEGLAAAKINGCVGFINKKGDFIITPQFEYAGDFAGGLAMASVNGAYGYINRNGIFVIEPHFESCGDFSEGLAAVQTLDGWGYIDSKGKFVLPIIYESAESFINGLALVKLYDKKDKCYINKTGIIIFDPNNNDLKGISSILYGVNKYNITKTECTEFVNLPDSSILVEIPMGIFIMGNDKWSNQKPSHKVYLDKYYISKYEVTVGQFRKFISATGYITDAEKNGGASVYFNDYWQTKTDANWANPYFQQTENNPVVCVSWHDAKAYCDWAGLRLPTEAEWEKAAQGGISGKEYFWGDEILPRIKTGNYADKTAKKKLLELKAIDEYNDGYIYTSPVGSFMPNGYGLYDVAGNVWEWCNDWYGDTYYQNSTAVSNPTGSSTGTERVLRGGSWWDVGYRLKTSARFQCNPNERNSMRGFRVAK